MVTGSPSRPLTVMDSSALSSKARGSPKNAGDHPVFWQGPSVGWDFGGDGNRTMMLVYNLTEAQKIYRRFVGVSGSAYFVGGIGMTVLKHGDTVLVPVRTGIGARLGVNVGYLKLREEPTWNPF